MRYDYYSKLKTEEIYTLGAYPPEGKLKDEAGASPALSRNCKFQVLAFGIEMPVTSQVARHECSFHKPRGKEVERIYHF
jgi:hypothetical protein